MICELQPDTRADQRVDPAFAAIDGPAGVHVDLGAHVGEAKAGLGRDDQAQRRARGRCAVLPLDQAVEGQDRELPAVAGDVES